MLEVGGGGAMKPTSLQSARQRAQGLLQLRAADDFSEVGVVLLAFRQVRAQPRPHGFIQQRQHAVGVHHDVEWHRTRAGHRTATAEKRFHGARKVVHGDASAGAGACPCASTSTSTGTGSCRGGSCSWRYGRRGGVKQQGTQATPSYEHAHHRRVPATAARQANNSSVKM